MKHNLLRTCIIGAGRMGQLRAPLLFSNPRVQLDHIVDPFADLGKPLAEKFRAKYHNNLDSVDFDDVDAMVICTGTFNHAEVITRAAEAKLPVFCEKPIHEDPNIIKQLFEVCEEHGVSLCCGFQRRFDASYIAMKREVEEGKIGTPTMVRVMFADHPSPSLEFLLKGGCPYMDLAPHDLDYLCWALDDVPISVYATGSSSNAQLAKKNIADTAMITVKFKKGAIGTIMMSRGATYGYDQRMEIFGTKGMINLDNEVHSTHKLYDKSGVHSALLKHSFPQRFHDAFQAEMDLFVHTCLGKANWPIKSKDCINTQVIAMAAARSAELGTVVELDL